MGKTMLSIGTNVRSLLLSDEKVQELVSSKVFPLAAPEETEGAFITIKRDDYSFKYNKMGPYDETAGLIISCFSNDYDESMEIAEAVLPILKDLTINKTHIQIDNCTEDVVSYSESKTLWYAQSFSVSIPKLDRR